MISLGIDPGTVQMGYCFYDGSTIVKSGTVKTQDWKKGKNTLEFLQCTDAFISELLDLKPDIVWIERTFAQTAMYSSLLVIMTNVMLDRTRTVAPTKSPSVKQWRKILTNNGAIDKKRIIAYIKKRFDIECSDDEAEAIGISVAAHESYGKEPDIKRRKSSTAKQLVVKP